MQLGKAFLMTLPASERELELRLLTSFICTSWSTASFRKPDASRSSQSYRRKQSSYIFPVSGLMFLLSLIGII